jgi:hypothetical protein
MLIDWMCYRIVMAWPLPLPDCRDSRAFAWCLARAGAYADPTPNVEVRGDAPLYGAASLSTDGLGVAVPSAPTFEKD